MGLFRKTMSIATLGTMVSYRSKEDRKIHHAKVTAKEAKKQSKLLAEQNRLLRAQSRQG